MEALVEAALEQPTEQRAPFLDQTIGDDTELRRTVDGLLDAHRQVADQLEVPAVERLRMNTTFAGPSTGSGERSRSDSAWAIPPRVSATAKQIGPYRIVRELGKGGMGAVYLAERDDDAFERQVAIKLVRAELGFGALEAQFHRERQILANLDHPNIARLFDGGRTDDGRSYFVMEHIDGLPLDRYCAEHQLGLRARLDLFTAVCRAVQYAHQNLVVHRDLKPNNVLVTPDGTVKLLDFGIAKLLEPSGERDGVETTRFGSRALTPNYASPEQLRGKAVNTASDVYSLGVVLYQLLTGDRPYSLDLPDPTALERMLESDVAPPSNATVGGESAAPVSAGSLRGDLDTIVLKCLQRDPVRRYGSAEALAEDLERHRVGLPIRARKDTLGYRLGRFVQRNKLATSLAATIFLLLTALAGAMAWRSHSVRQEAMRNARKTSQTFFTSTTALQVDEYLGRLDCLAAQLVSHRGLFEDQRAAAFRELLDNTLQAQPRIAAITVLDAEGRGMFKTHRLELSIELDPIQDSIESGQIALHQPSRQYGLDKQWIAWPRRLKREVGTLLLIADGEPLVSATRSVVPDDEIQNWIIDANGESLFTESKRAIPQSGPVALALSSPRTALGINIVKEDDERSLVVYKRLRRAPWILVSQQEAF